MAVGCQAEQSLVCPINHGGKMSKGIHRQWGEKDMLYFCPKKKTIWQYDREGNIHMHRDMPSYGIPRREMPNV